MKTAIIWVAALALLSGTANVESGGSVLPLIPLVALKNIDIDILKLLMKKYILESGKKDFIGPVTVDVLDTTQNSYGDRLVYISVGYKTLRITKHAAGIFAICNDFSFRPILLSNPSRGDMLPNFRSKDETFLPFENAYCDNKLD